MAKDPVGEYDILYYPDKQKSPEEAAQVALGIANHTNLRVDVYSHPPSASVEIPEPSMIHVWPHTSSLPVITNLIAAMSSD